MKLNYLRKGERLDNLGDGVDIIQNPAFFSYGTDAVLLADFAVLRKGDNIIDLCSGNGVIALLLSKKTCESITSLELLPQNIDMARRSAQMNGLSNRLRFHEGCVKRVSEYFPAASFSVVTINPPYIPVGAGRVNPNFELAVARHELACSLEDCIAAARRLLTPSGRLYMAHKPERLPEIFCVLRAYKLEPKTLLLVQKRDLPPAIALIEARNGGRAGLKVLPNKIIL